MKRDFASHFASELESLRSTGQFKAERILTSHQSSEIAVSGHGSVLNLCANNYLGLADNEELRSAAKRTIDRYGYGLASVRFICGTLDDHKTLETRLSEFLGMEDSMLYSSCFDANGGLFEALLTEQDAIISDSLNHASIIDGIRLSKAQRFRYASNDMTQLEASLREAADARFRLIATDGVFSMDGSLADLPRICDLADKYDAAVMVDDSHAVGLLGRNGRGTPEHYGVEDRVDILTGTLGKALGGASGGYTSAGRSVIEWLRQRSRPYLFSNTLMPAITGTSIVALDLVQRSTELRRKLNDNANRFRASMAASGFKLLGADHPIVPIMIGEARLAVEMSARLLERGIYVVGFSYPVVPQGQARIRTQMSAAHSSSDIDRAVEAFNAVGRDLGVI